MPVLPAAQRERLGGLGADPSDAHIIVNRGLAPLVLGAVEAGADANRVVTHAVQNLALKGAALLVPDHLASLVQMEISGSSRRRRRRLAWVLVVGLGLWSQAAAWCWLVQISQRRSLVLN
ncbi:hypothetical protein [Candidatus Poriferisodalis sp.]|uniref:hypothetical protein n=1 Tax=Candidatus Poriferisodalis sp. TaxID=3101277 RepID=UPI003B029EE5